MKLTIEQIIGILQPRFERDDVLVTVFTSKYEDRPEYLVVISGKTRTRTFRSYFEKSDVFEPLSTEVPEFLENYHKRGWKSPQQRPISGAITTLFALEPYEL